MNAPTQYIHAGIIVISIANLIVIALLLVVFALAVIARRPGEHRVPTIDFMPDEPQPLKHPEPRPEAHP